MKIKENITFSKLTAITISSIGLLGALITIYAFFSQNRNLNLQYEVLANSNVLDINAEITKLDILYDGNSLKQKNENLRILNIKVINNGSEHILSNYYDENDPLGLEISNGIIIENPEILDASNNYLKNNLKIKKDTNNRIYFSKVIIESNEYFILKILILHKSNESPTIIPVGKIAGIKSINIINNIKTPENISFFHKVFEGSILVQIVKGFVYFLIVVIIIILIALISESINNYKKRRRRKILIKNFLETEGKQVNRIDEAIFDLYRKDGQETIKLIHDFLSDEAKVNQIYTKFLKKEDDNSSKIDEFDIRAASSNYVLYRHNKKYLFDRLFKTGFLIKEDKKVSINNPMKKTLDAFIEYLKKKKEIEKNSDIVSTTIEKK